MDAASAIGALAFLPDDDSRVLPGSEAAPADVRYGRPVRRLWLFAREHALDLLIVVGAAAAALNVVMRQDHPGEGQAPASLAAPALALVVLPLLWRRRFPFAAPAAVWLFAAALSFVDPRLPGLPVPYLAGLAAAAMLGSVRDPVKARLGLGVVLAGSAAIVFNSPAPRSSEQLYIPLIFAVAWLAGFLLRGRAEQAEAAEERAGRAERERAAAARLAVAEERTRIARELHDVVAHTVSVMVLQVGAVRLELPASLEDDREALRGVETTGRAALAEMRRVLGALRHDGDEVELAPQPGLDDLGDLLERVGQAGVPVRLNVEGEPTPLPRAIDLSAYRIVQEGLTNTLKHARASRADVVLRYGEHDLEIEVSDDGDAGAGAAGNGHGHGLVGVRERVTVYGGEMRAGPAPGGGFVLAARLPLGEEPR